MTKFPITEIWLAAEAADDVPTMIRVAALIGGVIYPDRAIPPTFLATMYWRREYARRTNGADR